MHSLLQKLQVFTNSRKDTRKSSNDSPGCCVRRLKFLHSTDSLIWPLIYHLIAPMMEVTLFLSSSSSSRFYTIVRVSREKHKVSAWTCLSPESAESPDRLIYESHWACHAAKSEPRSTCKSSLGRPPCQNTYSILCGEPKGNWCEKQQTGTKVFTLTGASTGTREPHRGL